MIFFYCLFLFKKNTKRENTNIKTQKCKITLLLSKVNNQSITFEVRPDPKYKVGDWIKLKNGREGKICYPPRWNNWSKWDNVEPQWYYNYDYYTHIVLWEVHVWC